MPPENARLIAGRSHDHNWIDPHARVCRDCGQPVSDEMADSASERIAEAMYGRGL